jgi:hypothetical protein
MLEYLKKVIGEQLEEQEPVIEQEEAEVEVDDSTILEYASIFQELDDLSMTGTGNEDSVRPPIDIPLDDDIELETIEMNITDGRVTDIPSDATAAEQEEIMREQAEDEFNKIDQKYAGLKTYQEFYDEIYDNTERFTRESESRFKERVKSQTDKVWKEYTNMLFQEGLFGFGMISVNDISVPDKIHMNFGKTSEKNDKDFVVVLPILWEVDKQGRITKKQLDTVHVWSKFGKMGLQRMSDQIFEKVCEKYKVEEGKEKWDVMTPVKIAVLVKPEDMYEIHIAFETEFSRDLSWWAIGIPVKAVAVKGNKDIRVPENAMGRINSSKNERVEKCIRKRDFKLEYGDMFNADGTPKRHSRFWQEAIDFGGGDNAGGDAGNADANNPPPTDDGGAADANADTDAAPPDPNDIGDVDAAADGGADTEVAPDAKDASVNDVSDQIADNVSKSTEDAGDTEGKTDDLDVDIDSGDTDVDANPEDNADMDVDSEIESLGDTENNTEDVGDEVDMSNMSNEELDNMSVDQLIDQGAEKLKAMPISQLKSFITSPDGSTPDGVTESATDNVSEDDDVVQEGLFTNPKKQKNMTGNALEKIIARLKKIHEGIKSGWTDKEIAKQFKIKAGVSSVSVGVPTTGVSIGYDGDRFAKELKELTQFAKKHSGRTDISKEDKRKFKSFMTDMKDYIKTCTTLLRKNKAGIKEIDDLTVEMISTAEQLKSVVRGEKEDQKDDVNVEYMTFEFDLEDGEEENDAAMDAMYEEAFNLGGKLQYKPDSFLQNFTVSGNVKERINNTLVEVVGGLEKLINGVDKEKWTKKDILKFLGEVRNGSARNNLMGMSAEAWANYEGDNFLGDLAELFRYVWFGAKRLRTRSAFTSTERKTLTEFADDITDFTTVSMKLFNNFRGADVSRDDVSEAAKTLLEKCRKVQSIVSGDKSVTESADTTDEDDHT